MANLTANEQFMLELTNRARMDPVGEAKRMGISLNQGLSKNAISSTPKQVLAGNDLLAKSADAHSAWMIKTDTFSHFETGRTETATMRMKLAGYTFEGAWSNGENISLVGTSGTLDLTKSILDQHKNLFLSTSGHRQNMLGDAYREAGIGQASGDYKGYNTSMVTQNFATSGTDVFVTGVVYNDTKKNDNFFTVGEQQARIAVTGTDGVSDTTGTGGGYELGFATQGSKTITFAGSAGEASVRLTLGATNVKVDLVNGTEIWTNASVTSLTGTIKELHALGVSKMNLTGSSVSEKIYGNAANNSLTGNGGNDQLTGNAGNDVINGGTGVDKLSGGSGSDRFVFHAGDSGLDKASDTISDFGDSGTDRIDLSALFEGTLTYRGGSAITDVHQVRVTASGKDVIVHVNLEGDHADEMQIRLVGTTLKEMSSGDFIL